MTELDPRLMRRLKLAGLLLGAGLVIEMATLLWSHPTAFLFFLVVGGTLVGAGVLLYLHSVVTYSAAAPPP